MLKPIDLLIVFISTAFLSSCTANYFISVMQNGSAKVEADIYRNNSNFDIYFSSNIISNIDTTSGRLIFDISSIDSLGNYLPYLTKGFLQFKKDANEIIISENNATAFQTKNNACCHIFIKIQFDQEIHSVTELNKNLKKLDKSTIQLSKSRKHLVKGKKTIDVKILLKGS